MRFFFSKSDKTNVNKSQFLTPTHTPISASVRGATREACQTIATAGSVLLQLSWLRNAHAHAHTKPLSRAQCWLVSQVQTISPHPPRLFCKAVHWPMLAKVGRCLGVNVFSLPGALSVLIKSSVSHPWGRVSPAAAPTPLHPKSGCRGQQMQIIPLGRGWEVTCPRGRCHPGRGTYHPWAARVYYQTSFPPPMYLPPFLGRLESGAAGGS